jgi:integrase
MHFIMAGKQAKILSDEQTSSLLVFASSTRNPRRNHLILLLSLKAGLRAGEIANLTWDMVLGPTGEIGQVIELRDCAAKKNSGRRIPIHPSLRAALTEFGFSAQIISVSGPSGALANCARRHRPARDIIPPLGGT